MYLYLLHINQCRLRYMQGEKGQKGKCRLEYVAWGNGSRVRPLELGEGKKIRTKEECELRKWWGTKWGYGVPSIFGGFGLQFISLPLLYT